jgi:hypothetical protein
MIVEEEPAGEEKGDENIDCVMFVSGQDENHSGYIAEPRDKMNSIEI